MKENQKQKKNIHDLMCERVYMKQTYKEFKAFLNRGSALDLAIGLVMGTAFNNIIKSLVTHIITPVISLVSGTSFHSMFIVLRGSVSFDETLGTFIPSQGAILLEYGKFITSIMDFFIVALALFLTLKVITYLNKTYDKVKKDIKDDVSKIIEKKKK
jgi:large conductance mechanosensitive channel